MSAILGHVTESTSTRLVGQEKADKPQTAPNGVMTGHHWLNIGSPKEKADKPQSPPTSWLDGPNWTKAMGWRCADYSPYYG